ncbi:hypothetical protein GCM10027054_19590 [Isoptericola nanjingensis]
MRIVAGAFPVGTTARRDPGDGGAPRGPAVGSLDLARDRGHAVPRFGRTPCKSGPRTPRTSHRDVDRVQAWHDELGWVDGYTDAVLADEWAGAPERQPAG